MDSLLLSTLVFMKAITLSATFDGDRIRLEDDFPIPKNARLLVTVLPATPDDDRAFRAFWRSLATQSLARACGPDGPEYTLATANGANPHDEGR